MTKLPLVSSDTIIRTLNKAGFEAAPHQGKGSHGALHTVDDDGNQLLVIIPHRNPVPRGTLISILKTGPSSQRSVL